MRCSRLVVFAMFVCSSAPAAFAQGFAVDDTQRALRLYRDILGFAVGDTWRASSAELALNGLDQGALELTATAVGATVVLFSDFTLRDPSAAEPFDWRIQDVGSPQFQLEVSRLDALIERTKAAGYRFLSVDAQPIERLFGRFVFALDADSILVEYAEPAASR